MLIIILTKMVNLGIRFTQTECTHVPRLMSANSLTHITLCIIDYVHLTLTLMNDAHDILRYLVWFVSEQSLLYVLHSIRKSVLVLVERGDSHPHILLVLGSEILGMPWCCTSKPNLILTVSAWFFRTSGSAAVLWSIKPNICHRALTVRTLAAV